VRPSGAYQ